MRLWDLPDHQWFARVQFHSLWRWIESSPSLSLTPRNITTVQMTNTPPMTPAAIVYTCFCREKEQTLGNVSIYPSRSTDAAPSRLFLDFLRSLIHGALKNLTVFLFNMLYIHFGNKLPHCFLIFFNSSTLCRSSVCDSLPVTSVRSRAHFAVQIPAGTGRNLKLIRVPKYRRLKLQTDRNCSALNNLCLFAIFPCGSAQQFIIIYAHQTLPVSEARRSLPRRCATLTSDHGGM